MAVFIEGAAVGSEDSVRPWGRPICRNPVWRQGHEQAESSFRRQRTTSGGCKARGLMQSASTGTHLSVVVPTYNEKANIAPMVASLDRALGSLDWEVIFVDDGSPDGTAEEVRAIARARPPGAPDLAAQPPRARFGCRRRRAGGRRRDRRRDGRRPPAR